MMDSQQAKTVLVIGSGISGLASAIRCAELGMKAILASPMPSERSQSIMAAGGINAAQLGGTFDDSTVLHASDTFKGGCEIEDPTSVEILCNRAPDVLDWLESLGVMFNREPDGSISRRAFGGQSRKRTAYAGTSTGKQIVTALVQRCRQFECEGKVELLLRRHFYSAIMLDGNCHGALLLNDATDELEVIPASATIMATGGQNRLFGKTTGSLLNDGYAAGALLEQGVTLRNLEFIQYHPTTIETSHKHMLISEAARGEGGRLFYEQDGKRVYFMEELYGPKGNLMPRDIMSRCTYEAPSQVYLDISFLGEEVVHQKLQEIYDTCLEYLGLDVTREPIPVAPCVHFFMGGIHVNNNHKTNVEGLYAVGECASHYHGANRLGGNSMLAAALSGRIAAESIASELAAPTATESAQIKQVIKKLKDEAAGRITAKRAARGSLSVARGERLLADALSKGMGVSRCEEGLMESLEGIKQLRESMTTLRYDEGLSAYENNRLPAMALLAEACVRCALHRKETRGAQIRTDYPETNAELACNTLVAYKDGQLKVWFDNDNRPGE